MKDSKVTNLETIEECPDYEYISPDLARLYTMAENDQPGQSGAYCADGYGIQALWTNVNIVCK